MCEIREFYYESVNHSEIYCIEWIPAAPPRAVLQLSHGIMEHIGRYDNFARYMADRGILVVGNNHLGHGKMAAESGNLGFFADENGWMTVVQDMHQLYQLEHAKYPDLPYFILGHSMGSFLTRTYLTLYPNELRGAILSGTAQTPKAINNLGLIVAAVEKKIVTPKGKSKRLNQLCFGSYPKKFSPAKTKYCWISSDEEIENAYLSDPFCGFIPTASMFSDMLEGIKYITDKKNLIKMQKDLPIYFFSGALDPVGETGKGVKRAYESFLSVGCTDVSIKIYPNGRHEMLNETNRDEVYRDILDWIECKLPDHSATTL